jgi:hypothetical protein
MREEIPGRVALRRSTRLGASRADSPTKLPSTPKDRKRSPTQSDSPTSDAVSSVSTLGAVSVDSPTRGLPTEKEAIGAASTRDSPTKNTERLKVKEVGEKVDSPTRVLPTGYLVDPKGTRVLSPERVADTSLRRLAPKLEDP